MNMELDKNIREYLSIQELRNYKKNFLLVDFINSKLKNVFISIGSVCKSTNAKELVKTDMLNGFCYNATSIVAPFFGDFDMIHRGIIRLGENSIEHAWIKFYLLGKEYAFDPSLGILVPYDLYAEKLKIFVCGRVLTQQVKKDSLELLNSSTKDDCEYKIVTLGNIDSSWYNNKLYLNGSLNKEKTKIKNLNGYFVE